LNTAEAEPHGSNDRRSSPDSAHSASIVVTLEHDRNRQLLTEWLSESYAVAETTPDAVANESVDLFVLDPPALERHAEALAERTAAALPAFLPVLLVQPATDGDVPPAVWDLVDDVIRTPVSQPELAARIAGLVDRRRLSRELSRSEDRFRTLIAVAPDPVFVLEAETLVTVNDAFTDLTGTPIRECIGKPLSTVLGHDTEALLGNGPGVTDASQPGCQRDQDADGLRTDGEVEIGASEEGRRTIQYVGPTGETTFLEVNLTTLTDGDDRLQIGVLRDVTERVERTRELGRQNDRLEEFASTLSHELRNPLNIASGWVQNARSDIDAETFEQIDAAHERMAAMIDELLDLARKGEIIEERRSVDLDTVARTAWSEFETGTASLVVEVPPETSVAADGDRLRDVLVNLFKNSVLHGGDGVTVRLEVLPTGDGVAVEDDGQGFALDTPAEALQPGVTTATDGTGYGLSIVQQVVSAHGWTIEAVESGDGGARFEIRDVELATP
jgi:signal transduction histidine kinase